MEHTIAKLVNGHCLHRAPAGAHHAGSAVPQRATLTLQACQDIKHMAQAGAGCAGRCTGPHSLCNVQPDLLGASLRFLLSAASGASTLQWQFSLPSQDT